MSNLLDKCSKLGLKMTDQRKVIIEVLSTAVDHPDVESVFKRAQAIDPKISIATVYRTIRIFEENNLLENMNSRVLAQDMRQLGRTITI